MRSAARVARTFHLDPMLVLDADQATWLIRIAAHNVIQDDAEKAAEKK